MGAAGDRNKISAVPVLLMDVDDVVSDVDIG